MVDFKKALEDSKKNGKFLGYCYREPCLSKLSKVHEIDILPAYKDAILKEQKAICPKCKNYILVYDLIPF